MSAGEQENKLQHPCFPQPEDSTVKVWRYLDLAKFIWLLDNKKLYLPRLELLNDPHEGSLPRRSAEQRDQLALEFARGESPTVSARISEKMRESTQQFRKLMYVNCWHLGNEESEAMWRLYCPGDSGVAIQTTYGKLVESVIQEPYLYIGRVTYIDYQSGSFPWNNSFYPVMHKRMSFRHEQEIRIVKCDGQHLFSPSTSPPALTTDWSGDIVESCGRVELKKAVCLVRNWS